MTAQEQFQLERKPVNSARHDGLVDPAHQTPAQLATLAAAAPVASTAVRRSLGLPTTVGAAFNVPIGGNVSAAMNQARDSEVVALVAGTYPQSSAFTCTANNFTLSGVPGATILKFQTGGPFAITFSGTAFGVVFDGIAIDNNGGCVVFNKGTVDCTFRRSSFKFNGSGSSACGIRSLAGDVRQKIDQSLFCDSPNSYRDIDSYGQTDCTYTNNSFIGTCYGPHIDGPKSGVITYSGNTGTMWNRNMGVEMQDHNTTQGSGKIIFTNNVFYGFGPGITNNTYLASVPVQNSGDLLVDGNYLCLGDFVTEAAAAVLATKGYRVFPNSKGADGLVYVEAPQVGGSNIGIGIENGSEFTTCTNNIVIGSVCVSIVTCQPNTKVSGNKTHGRKKNGNWGNVAYSGEPGNRPASFIPSDPSTANTIIEVIDGNTPRPPRRARRDPWNDDTQPDNTMNITASNITESDADFAFSNLPTGIVAIGLGFQIRDGAIPLGSVPLKATDTGAKITGLQTGRTQIAALIVSTAAGTTTAEVTIKTAGIGSSVKDPTKIPALRGGVIPPDPDPIIETTQITVKKHKSGKLETSAVVV